MKKIKVVIAGNCQQATDIETAAEDCKFEFYAAGTCKETCMEMIRELQPQLVIAATEECGFGGQELIPAVRRAGLPIDIILIAGSCDSRQLLQAKRWGVCDYLLTPFVPERLRLALQGYRHGLEFAASRRQLDQQGIDYLRGVHF